MSPIEVLGVFSPRCPCRFPNSITKFKAPCPRFPVVGSTLSGLCRPPPGCHVPIPWLVQNSHHPWLSQLPTWFCVWLLLWQFCLSHHLDGQSCLLDFFLNCCLLYQHLLLNTCLTVSASQASAPLRRKKALFSCTQCLNVTAEKIPKACAFPRFQPSLPHPLASFLFPSTSDVYWMIVVCQILQKTLDK